MKIRLLQKEEYHGYESLAESSSPTFFIRSTAYGKFYESMGEQFCIVGFFNDQDELFGGALCVSVHAKRGNYWYCPYGPIVQEGMEVHLPEIVKQVPLALSRDGYDFFKWSPYLPDTEEQKTQFLKAGFTLSPLHILPETIWYLDLSSPEEELLMNMRKTTRNLVRRADRDGIVVTSYTEKEALKYFFPLFHETSKRHHFVGFSEEYITKEFAAMEQGGNASLYVARHEGDIIAASVIYFFGDTGVYRHGASTSGPKGSMPASYAIQWQAIRDAKNNGCRYYNFWGIAPDNAPKSHPFSGITLFKTGFGGMKKEVLHCMDYPYSGKYRLYWILESIRKWRRGF